MGALRCAAARRGGEEYLLERGLFRRKSTGAVVQPAYLEFAFPYYWHYDVLRALDYFRRSGTAPDPRMAEAVSVLKSKRQPDGRWLLERIHPGRVHFHLERWRRHAKPLEHPPSAQGARVVGRSRLTPERRRAGRAVARCPLPARSCPLIGPPRHSLRRSCVPARDRRKGHFDMRHCPATSTDPKRYTRVRSWTV